MNAPFDLQQLWLSAPIFVVAVGGVLALLVEAFSRLRSVPEPGSETPGE